VQCLVSLSDGLAGYTFPLYNTLVVQKPPAGSTEPVRAPGPVDPTTLPETEPARSGLRTVCAVLNAGWPALLPALSFLLTTNLSDSIFGNVLGGLQTLARAAARRVLCTAQPRDAFFTALAKAALPPRVVTALDEPQQAFIRVPLPPSHLRDSNSVWREMAEVAPHHAHWDLAHAIWRAYGRSSLPRLSRAVLPRLVRYPLASVLLRRASVVEPRLKGRWNNETEASGGSACTSRGRRFRERASCHTAAV
jgi:hypothetical protein